MWHSTVCLLFFFCHFYKERIVKFLSLYLAPILLSDLLSFPPAMSPLADPIFYYTTTVGELIILCWSLFHPCSAGWIVKEKNPRAFFSCTFWYWVPINVYGRCCMINVALVYRNLTSLGFASPQKIYTVMPVDNPGQIWISLK